MDWILEKKEYQVKYELKNVKESLHRRGKNSLQYGETKIDSQNQLKEASNT